MFGSLQPEQILQPAARPSRDKRHTRGFAATLGEIQNSWEIYVHDPYGGPRVFVCNCDYSPPLKKCWFWPAPMLLLKRGSSCAESARQHVQCQGHIRPTWRVPGTATNVQRRLHSHADSHFVGGQRCRFKPHISTWPSSSSSPPSSSSPSSWWSWSSSSRFHHHRRHHHHRHHQ